MVTITLLLLVAAFILTILSAMGRPWLWIATLLVIIVLLLQVLPR